MYECNNNYSHCCNINDHIVEDKMDKKVILWELDKDTNRVKKYVLKDNQFVDTQTNLLLFASERVADAYNNFLIENKDRGKRSAKYTTMLAD